MLTLDASSQNRHVEYPSLSSSIAQRRAADDHGARPDAAGEPTPRRCSPAGAALGAACVPRAGRRDPALARECSSRSVSVVLKTEGDPAYVLEADAVLLAKQDDWLVREITPSGRSSASTSRRRASSRWSSRAPASRARSSSSRSPPTAPTCWTTTTRQAGALSPMNAGPSPMGNGLTRLQTRFYGAAQRSARLEDEAS